MSLNNVTLMGRLVADPELRTTTSGKSVATFTIAVDRPYSKNKEADFPKIVAWENTADFVAKYFSKGSMIALRGEIQTRNFEDKNGNKRTATEVVAREVSFCGGKNESNNASTPTYAPIPADYEEIDSDSDLPF